MFLVPGNNGLLLLLLTFLHLFILNVQLFFKALFICLRGPKGPLDTLALVDLFVIMPPTPFEEEGVYCFAFVGLSGGLSVGR